jgi:bacteriocin biosynthesis cyclodehydratase domain-containing protein
VVRLDGAAAVKLLPRLLPLLDGTRTVDEIVGCLGAAVRPAVEHALELLEEHGLLRDGPAVADGGDTVARLLAASASERSELELTRILAAAQVGVAGSGRAAAEVARSLRGAGIERVVQVDWGRATRADLVFAAPAREELEYLEAWNRVALAAESPWLQLLPFDGRFAAVGPLFVPGETCCYMCYSLRRQANVPYPGEFAALEATPLSASTPPPLVAALAGLTALVASRWLTTADPALPGRLFAVELRPGPSVEAHHVYRVPRCPACAPASVRPLPWFKETGAAVA